MNMGHVCEIPRDTGYSNVCQICGVPSDAGYFDVASIQDAPGIRTNLDKTEVELARHELHPQYCGTLLYFAQFAGEEQRDQEEEQQKPRRQVIQVISHTPGYEWIILCNDQPRAPYLPTSLILNPWGHNAFPIQLTIGRRVHGKVRGQKGRSSGGAEVIFIPSRRPTAGPHLVQHHLRRRAQPAVEMRKDI